MQTSIGVDIGGTFTDVVAVDDDGAHAHRQGAVHALATRARPCARVLTRLLPDWRIAAARVAPFRARHDGRHQRGARAQGRAPRAPHHRRLQGRARDRPPEPAPDLRPRAEARDAGFLAPGARRRGVAERDGAARRSGDAARRGVARSARSTRCSRKASRRSPSASCSPSPIPRTSGGAPRRSASAIRSLVVSLSSRRRPGVPRIRAHRRHRASTRT